MARKMKKQNMQCSGKKNERTRLLQYCFFEAQKFVRKKSVTIYSTFDENLNLPSILHVAPK